MPAADRTLIATTACDQFAINTEDRVLQGDCFRTKWVCNFVCHTNQPSVRTLSELMLSQSDRKNARIFAHHALGSRNSLAALDFRATALPDRRIHTNTASST